MEHDFPHIKQPQHFNRYTKKQIFSPADSLSETLLISGEFMEKLRHILSLESDGKVNFA